MSTIGFPSNGLTLVSLFAGCGGSSLGYRMAGYDIRLAVEQDRVAAETYRRNFPGAAVHEGDICALSAGEALRLARVAPGELDVLDGSPPCQGFSLAGKRRFGDRRNRLFEEYVRLLAAFRPRAAVMENVPGLIKGKMRLVFAEMTAALKEAGYRVACRLLNAWWYGVPQDRRRLIWVGVREDVMAAPSHPAPTAREPVTVAEALGYRLKYEVVGAWERGRGPLRRAARFGYEPILTLGALGFGGQRHPVVVPQLPTERHAPQVIEAWHAAAPGRSLRRARRYVGSFQSVRLDPAKPSPSQIAAHRNWRWDEPRQLTVEEAKALHGFPPWFDVGEYRLVGNSVPPPMAEAVGRHIAALLGGGADGHG